MGWAGRLRRKREKASPFLPPPGSEAGHPLPITQPSDPDSKATAWVVAGAQGPHSLDLCSCLLDWPMAMEINRELVSVLRQFSLGRVTWKPTQPHTSSCSCDLFRYRSELDGTQGFLSAYWEVWDGSFVHLFSRQQFTEHLLDSRH